MRTSSQLRSAEFPTQSILSNKKSRKHHHGNVKRGTGNRAHKADFGENSETAIGPDNPSGIGRLWTTNAKLLRPAPFGALTPAP